MVMGLKTEQSTVLFFKNAKGLDLFVGGLVEQEQLGAFE